jgi:hypothetical protein
MPIPATEPASPRLSDARCPDNWLELHSIFRNSEFATPPGKGVEMLNYAPHGVVEDVVMLPGNVPLPILASTLEYDPALPEAAYSAFKKCVHRLDSYPDLLRPSADSLDDLIRVFFSTICADAQLPSIYAGHLAADLAYEQSLQA